MAHFTFSGISRNSQGSAVLVDSSRMFGAICNLTARASRATANQGYSKRRQTRPPTRKLSTRNNHRRPTHKRGQWANDRYRHRKRNPYGMSASTTLTTAARDLDDDAIQAIISMVPTTTPPDARPHHRRLNVRTVEPRRDLHPLAGTRILRPPPRTPTLRYNRRTHRQTYAHATQIKQTVLG
jgi:hypothetical protein